MSIFLLQSLNSFCQWPFVHSSYNLSVNAQLSKAKCNIAMVEYQRLTAIAKKKRTILIWLWLLIDKFIVCLIGCYKQINFHK